MEELYNYIEDWWRNKIELTKRNSQFKLDDDEKKYLVSICSKLELKKDKILIKPGTFVNKQFFIIEGCLRSFCMDSKGKEHTLQFAVKDHWISDYISLYSNKKSTLFIQATTDSLVLCFNTLDIYKLINKYPNISLLHRKSLERHIADQGERIINQLQLTAEERYNLFLKNYPNINQLALNYHIASFLGITQQSLSRIRSDFKN